MEASVIVAYIVALLAGGAKGFAEKKVEHLLSQLYDRVKARLGRQPAIKRLEHAPEDHDAQRGAADAITAAARVDPSFRRDLAALAGQIEQRAPNLLIYAPNSDVVTGIDLRQTRGGVGDVRGTGNVITVYNGSGMSDAEYEERELQSAPFILKAMFVIGALLCITGMGRFFYFVLFQGMSFPTRRGFPVAVQQAFGLFFIGFVLVGVAKLGSAFGHRRAQ